MPYLNSVILVGHLGKDPEIRHTSGSAVTNFSIATRESYVKDNQKFEKTEWHRIVVWGKSAENCAKYLKKGSAVFVQGKLQTRKWKNEDKNIEQTITEIVASQVQFLDTKPKENTKPQEQLPDPQGDFDLEDIPF